MHASDCMLWDPEVLKGSTDHITSPEVLFILCLHRARSALAATAQPGLLPDRWAPIGQRSCVATGCKCRPEMLLLDQGPLKA